MIILGDDSQHHGKIPWVTFCLVLVNVFVFFAQLSIGESFTMGFSLVPAEITEFRDITRPERVKVKVPADLYYDHAAKKIRTAYQYEYHTVNHYHGPFPIILTLITSMFLHGDWLHLIGNMWFLLVFGRNVECALDHSRFLAFYLTCGVAGGLAHVVSDMHSVIPCLGASGAISGIMGAYVSIHPFNLISLWFGWMLGVIKLPAIAVVGCWFVFQYLAAFMELESGVSDGVAYWEHLGGFGAGVCLIWGTIFYLKWQQASAPPQEEEPVVEMPEPPTPTTDRDPFATFMSGSNRAAPPPQTTGDATSPVNPYDRVFS